MVDVTATKKELEKIIVDESLVGVKVYAKNGEKIGLLDAIFLDTENFNIKAIQVNKGLFKFEHFIGSKYIKKLSPDGIILNILPLEDFIGKMVYDLNGSMVGKVVHINKVKNTNKLISLDVSHGIRKHNIVVAAASIKKVSESILLNIEM